MEKALHTAKHFPKRVKMLLDYGADINALNNDGYTAAMFAARDHSGWKTARLLVDSGADLKHKAPDGMTLARIVNEQMLDSPNRPRT